MKRKGPRVEPFCLDPVSGEDLIGRSAEKERLRGELAGTPGLILLHGDRGIGKTSLLRCLPELNTVHEFPVEYDAGKNLGFWGGVGEPLERLVGIGRAKTGVSLNFDILGLLGVSRAGAPEPKMPVGVEPKVLEYPTPGEQARFSDLCLRLQKLRRPICVRVRDAYRLPEVDQRWLLQLPADAGNVFVVLEAPDTYLDKLIAEVRREARRVYIGPLGRDAMLQVVARGGDWLTQNDTDRVVASAAGNPYYLQSICHVLWYRGKAEGLASVERTLDNLEADTAIADRLDIIHSEVLESVGQGTDMFLLVQAAAFAPVEFNEMVLRRLSDMDGSRFTHALRVVRSRGILSSEVRNSDRLRFYHPFFREYVREQAPLDERILNVRREGLMCEARDPETIQLMLSAHIDDGGLLMRLADRVSDAYVLNRLAGRLFFNGRMAEALAVLERLLVLAGTDRRACSIALGNMGLIYAGKGEPEKALKYHEEALKIDRELGDQEGVAGQLGNIGLIHQDRGELDKALEYHEEALRIARETGSQACAATQLDCIGLICRAKGELDMALKHHEEALKMGRAIGDRLVAAIAIGNIGLVYAAKGEPDKALEYHEEALRIDRETGYRRGVVAALGNIGSICLAKGELDKAQECYVEALRIARECGYWQDMAVILGNIGSICSAKGELDKAQEHYTEALGIARDTAHQEGVANQLCNIGLTLMDKEMYEQAVLKLVEALDLYLAIGMAVGTPQALGGLVECEDKLGRKPMEGLFKEAGLDAVASAERFRRMDEQREEMKRKPE